MSQSFEDKLKEKLEAFPSTPPADAERAILNQVNGKSWPDRWRGVLFVVAIGLLPLFFGNFHNSDLPLGSRVPVSSSQQPPSLTSARQKEKEEELPQQEVSILPPSDDATAAAARSPLKQTIEPTEKTTSLQGEPTAVTSTSTSLRATLPSTSSVKVIATGPSAAFVRNVTASVAQSSRDRGPQEQLPLPLASTSRGPILMDDLERKKSLPWPSPSPSEYSVAPVVTEDDAPIKELRDGFRPYVDVGTFFLYQNMQPNTSDEVYITDFEGAGRFSAKRLGFIAEGGIRRQVNEKLTLRVGTSLSMLNQNYSFSIRSQQPDSVTFERENPQEALSIFERSSIQASHRLWAVGTTITGDFYVLPDLGSTLFSSVGYHHLLNSTQSFVFNGERHLIQYPNQLLLTLGLRKLLWHRKYDQIHLSAQARYAMLTSSSKETGTLSVKPFSIGLTLSWTRSRRK